MSDIWFCGDCHSRFGHIIDAVQRRRPAAIVLLGDVQAESPLHVELAAITNLTDVFWIPGNHVTDSEQDYDNLFESTLADRNLHGRVVTVDGIRIAGLGGVFRGRVWMPPASPAFVSAKAYVAQAGKGNRWRGGLPLRHRSTIFPEDYDRLAKLSADVVVTHEAPGGHPHGNEALERLAIAMRAIGLFHGHTHDAIEYDDAAVKRYGVGLRGITSIDGKKIVEGELDEVRHREAGP